MFKRICKFISKGLVILSSSLIFISCSQYAFGQNNLFPYYSSNYFDNAYNYNGSWNIYPYTWGWHAYQDQITFEKVCYPHCVGYGFGYNNIGESFTAGYSSMFPPYTASNSLYPGLKFTDICYYVPYYYGIPLAFPLPFTYQYSPLTYQYFLLQSSRQQKQKVTLTSIEVAPDTKSFTAVGQTQQLTVTGNYSDGSNANLTSSTAGTTYTSSDPNVATVSTEGLVTAVAKSKATSATITVTNSSYSCSTKVTVSIIPHRIIDPIAKPDWFYAGEEPALVTIMAYIYPDEDLSEVKLLYLDGNNRVIDTLGYLSDDGRNGDAQADDNIYTIQKTSEGLPFDNQEEPPYKIRLQVCADYGTSYPITGSSRIFDILRLPPPMPGPPPPPPPPLEGSLRLLTFNTQLLDPHHVPDWMFPISTIEIIADLLDLSKTIEDEYGIKNKERTKRIAKQIKQLQSRPHIIALQEVFDEDARHILRDALSGIYPYYVYKLSGVDFCPEDSGLMLFSQYPFTQLPNPQYSYGGSGGRVAYIEFHQGYTPLPPDSWDVFADKGVGFVRIDLGLQRYVNIAFTHLQAWDDELIFFQKRRAQFINIHQIITGSLNNTNRENEPIFVMGDLNVNGNPASMHNKWTGSKNAWNTYKFTEGIDSANRLYEWDYHFNRDLENTYFSTDFSDSWMYDTISWIYDPVDSDPGQTTSSDYFPDYDDVPTQGERLDYILHINNKAMASATDASINPLTGESQYVIQHIYRVWKPALDPDQNLSDHLGVMADINLYSPHCNPLVAYDVQVDSSTPNAPIPGTIEHEGSMQWYRVDGEGGSYSFDKSANVKLDVYEAKDLSRPVEWSGQFSRWGKRYSVPEVPFYIRVSAVDPQFTGNYSILIHLHLGENKYDAIQLDSLTFYKPNPYGYGKLYTMPTFGTPLETVWFMIIPEWGYMNLSPSIKVIVDSISPLETFDVDLMDDNNHVIGTATKLFIPYEDPKTVEITYRSQLEKTTLPYPPSTGPYYPRVHVVGDLLPSLGQQFIIHWQTNLTYFRGGELRCYEQEDDTGDDDIVARIRVDGLPLFKNLGVFDDGTESCGFGSHKSCPWINDYGFVDSLSIVLYEDDDPRDYLGTETIFTLPMNQEMAENFSLEWKGPGPYCDPEGWYIWELGTRLYHKRPPKPKD